MPKLTDNSYTPHDLSGLMPSNLVSTDSDYLIGYPDMYGVVLPDIAISGLFSRTIPREVHDRLREESFKKYAELWSNLANM